MEIFLISFVVIAIAVLGMAIGVVLGRRPIKGSCGGLNTIDGLECACSTPCENKRRAARRGAEDAPGAESVSYR